MTGKRGRWVRNPFFTEAAERRRIQDVAWQGWSLRGGQEPVIWVEDDEPEKSKPGPKPILTDEQAQQAIDWLRKRGLRYAKQDVICKDLNALLGVNFEKTFWRKRVIDPVKKMRG